MSLFQNSVSFETSFGKNVLEDVFSYKSNVAVSKTEVLKQPRLIMKRGALLKILKMQGCVFVKHGGKHDQYIQPRTGKKDQVPRHPYISEDTARSIIKNLS